ncbi:MAG: tetratricopeptide repeat protein [Bacteriovoracaceae bacterium]|nr:tetratricopeptide repeat protein [Bacteriovoracaceae bacterium]
MAEQSAQTFEQVAERTDLGHFINHHRKSIIMGGVALIIAIFGFSFYRAGSQNQLSELKKEIFNFQKKQLLPLLEGKTKVEDFMKSYETLSSDLTTHEAFASVTISAASYLNEQQKYAEAQKLLEKSYQNLSEKSLNFFVVANLLTTVYENQNQLESAIQVAEKVVASPMNLLPARQYYQLARLYQTAGNGAKAKQNYEYVMSKYPDDEMAKLAKIKIQEIK